MAPLKGVGGHYLTFHQIQSILIQTFIFENLILAKMVFFFSSKIEVRKEERKSSAINLIFALITLFYVIQFCVFHFIF